ncbi:MAG: multicopper oxidase domain-containing protein [Rubrivivax sp.]|nr:multicopper oxidase domain-containing protein [Rubrivivax sp.]
MQRAIQRTALAAALAAGVGLAALPAQAAIQGLAGTDINDCAIGAGTGKGKLFDLIAAEGYLSTADGASVYAWGYGEAGKVMQYPAPTLIVEQGSCVRVRLTNQLPVRTSIIFGGQRDVRAGTTAGSNGGTQPGGAAAVKFTREVAPPRRATAAGPVLYSTITYTFVASEPGTYLYQSGSQPEVQHEMGLAGALIVRPAGAPKQAYAHAATAFDREALYVVSEIDPLRHQDIEAQVAAARAAAASPNANLPQNWLPNQAAWGSTWLAQYWFINGRNAPDTLTAAGTETLPHQPYNALARLHPGDRLLMRVVNIGRDLHPMHHHGNHSVTIARDGRMLASAAGAGPDLAQVDFTLRSLPGQTIDALWSWTGKGLGWDITGATCNAAQPVSQGNCPYGKFDGTGTLLEPGITTTTQDWSDLYKPMPTRMPAALELSFGEMFSGSPYLGQTGQRPVGAGLANQGGGIWHMFHSHNEREIINYGVFPGGLMTMLLIEHWAVQIDD